MSFSQRSHPQAVPVITKNTPISVRAAMSKSRIMYIEYKGEGIVGPARIGRVTFSKSGKTVYYGGKAFRSLKGSGFKSNYYDVETGDEYWISGCRKDGRDALYSTTVEIDADVAEEYWSEIRGTSQRVSETAVNLVGKYK